MKSKKTTATIELTKWERVFENENTISTWKYNSKISNTNPYEVVIQYKNESVEKKKRSPRKPKSD